MTEMIRNPHKLASEPERAVRPVGHKEIAHRRTLIASTNVQQRRSNRSSAEDLTIDYQASEIPARRAER